MNNNVYPSADFQARRFNRDIAWLSMKITQMRLAQDEFILLRGLFDNPTLYQICDGLIISNKRSIALEINLGDRIRFHLNAEPISKRYKGIMINEEFYFPTAIEKYPSTAVIHRLSL